MNKPKDSTAAAERKPDPVVALAARFLDARNREHGFDERGSEAEEKGMASAKIYLQHAENNAADEAYALRDMVSMERATTLAGALVQMGELSARLDMIWDQVPDKKGPHHQTSRDYRAAVRLIYSIISVLEDAAATTLHDLAGEDYASSNLNPWVPVELRCPDLREAAR